MSTSMARRGDGGGGRHQFPVGRRRHVPVVDSGCGCRPRRPRLLSLASFIWPSSSSSACKQAAARGGGGGSHSSPNYFRSSSSAASFSSSSAATTYSTASYYSSSRGGGAKKKKKQEEEPPYVAPPKVKVTAKSPSRRRKKTAEEDSGGVGVAVEKESSDPRADFRESMVQMVVEMGLCHWDDLRTMLRRLLTLNAPAHHADILTAFAEVCAQLAAPSPPAYGHHRR